MSEGFEFRTSYGGAEYMRFNRFHLFRKSWYITYAFPVIFGVISVANFAQGEKVGGIVFFVLALLIPLIMYGTLALTARHHLKTNKMYRDMKNVYYRLDGESLFSETKNKGIETTLKTDWDHVYRVYETKDSLYVYISNMQAFILPKADLVAGTSAELQALMREKLGKKFKMMA